MSKKRDPKNFFTQAEEAEIVAAIRAAENRTSGELRVHLEAHTDEPNREHAQKIFEEAGMTQTERRNGVLFYLATEDKQFTILGDKGINEKVPEGFWDDIRDTLQEHFRQDYFVKGLVAGIEMAGKALAEYFPVQDDDDNELSDEISKS
ncbi:MAG: TPM domain-containing protein [Schleiferiaceae bacterium]|jgi:uncharacterized membrane protein|nr:TPM domain-containing protein [Schleiferiaceae bacterium]MDR9442527.1 TPM domain-containing protein [Schleiferiaceae bacterium]